MFQNCRSTNIPQKIFQRVFRVLDVLMLQKHLRTALPFGWHQLQQQNIEAQKKSQRKSKEEEPCNGACKNPLFPTTFDTYPQPDKGAYFSYILIN